jgi:uncharacterized membrane protein YjfL (UPF0719 family)
MLESLGATLVYAVMGLGLLVLGYVLIDLLTPGHLGRALVGDMGARGNRADTGDMADAERRGRGPSYGAALILSSSILANGLVIFTALWTNVAAGLGTAVLWTLVFGVLGLVLQAVAFVLVDAVVPGKLADVIFEHDRVHPAAWVMASAHLAVAGIVAASIA